MKHTSAVQSSSHSYAYYMVLKNMTLTSPLFFLSFLKSLETVIEKMSSFLDESYKKVNSTLNIGIIYLDFEDRMHNNTVRHLFPDIIIKYCKFHLGQT